MSAELHDSGVEDRWMDWWLLEHIARTGAPGLWADGPGMVWLVRDGLVRHLAAGDRWMLTRAGRRALFRVWRTERMKDRTWVRQQHVPVVEELPADAVEAEICLVYGDGTPPPVPEPLRPHLSVQDFDCFGTTQCDRVALYEDMFFTPDTGPVRFLLEGASPYVAFGHGGHGANSYSFSYELVTDRLAVFVKTPGFGAYCDRDDVIRRREFAHGAIEKLLGMAEHAPTWPGEARLVVIQDELRGHGALAWWRGPVGEGYAEGVEAAVDWVRSHGCTGRPLEEALTVVAGVDADLLIAPDEPDDDLETHNGRRIAALGDDDPHCGFSFGAYYVQVAWNCDGSLVAEAVSNEYLDGPARLTPRQHRTLLDRGWSAPDLADGWPNYWRFYDAGVGVGDVAHELVTVLDLVYGLDLEGCER